MSLSGGASRMATKHAVVNEIIEEPRTTARSEPKFFVWMAGVMFFGILLAFAPTFFLSAYFPVDELPPRLIVHGTILTLWFGLYLLQSSLVAFGNRRLHARLGKYIAALSVVAVVGGLLATLFLVRHRLEGGADLETLVATGMPVPWFNGFMLIGFVTCMTLGVMNRFRPERHKRFMFLAFVSLYLPATGRIMALPQYFDAERLIAPHGGIILLTLFPLALCIYDVLTRGRVHMISAVGTVASPLLYVLARYMSTTSLGEAVVRTLA